MMEWLPAVLGFLIGAVLAWAIATARSKARSAAAEAREQEVRQQFQSRDTELHDVREKLADSERTRVAAETLAGDTERNLLQQRVLLEEARNKLGETFRSLVHPLEEALSGYQRATSGELGSVAEQLRGVAQAEGKLQAETARLVNALRSHQARGRWGEITLRRIVELAGMSSYCDFSEQESVSTEDGRLRPDMIVKLPADRVVVVDSKVPLEGYLDALEAVTEEEREAALTRHVAQVNQHIARLAAKEYWSQFSASSEFVVLFIPNDSFLAAAAERDRNLLETALAKRIVIATPATLFALLRAIEYGWRQAKLADNAQRISELGQELYDRLATWAEHLNKVGAALRDAMESYNAAVGSLEMRVFPAARKFKELGAGGKREIEELESIEQAPRPLTAPEREERP
ncbi:MAG: DNA recombination protein RmuC [Acidobacteria bacterium]|nr:DNA recombination protein RmuC [Acidobacteriota bacterium]